MEKYKILHLEDDDNDIELVLHVLKNSTISAEVTAVKDKEAFIKNLEQFDYDIILCDYSLPDINGMEALQIVRKILPDIPFIIVSGVVGDERATEVIRQGATDYVLKDKLVKLPEVIIRSINEAALLKQRHEQELITQQLLESSHAVLFKLNAQGVCTYMNERMKEILECANESIHCGNWLEYIHPDDKTTILSQWRDSIRNAELLKFECRMLTRKKNVIWISCHMRPQRDNKNNLSGFIGTIYNITKHKLIEKELKSFSLYDPLTKLPNRSFLFETAKRLVQKARRGHEHVGVLYIDIDYFKKVNDTVGHAAGDLLLVKVGERLKQSLRKSDFIARIGGDEFIIFLDNVNREKQTEILASRILESFKTPIYLDKMEVRVTVSIGISIYPFSGKSINQLIKSADQALYRAKAKGRNCFEHASKRETRVGERLIKIEHHLYHAIENHELYLAYQPQYRVSDSQLIGIEVLLRWKSKVLGNVHPGEFIPVAEETFVVRKVDYWTLKTALDHFSKWKKQYRKVLHDYITISVNVSVSHLIQDGFCSYLSSILEKYRIKPEWIILEMSESSISKYLDLIKETIMKLHKMNVCLAIDNFGTGYFSLRSLRDLPVKIIKIDKSFVQGISRSGNMGSIVKGIISLSKSLGISVVAGGVETKKQFEFLKAHKCDYMQGNYFSKPVDEKSIIKFFKGIKHAVH